MREIAPGTLRTRGTPEREGCGSGARKVWISLAAMIVTFSTGCKWLFPSEPASVSDYGRPAVLVWEAPGVGTGRVSVDADRVYFPGLHHTLTAVDKRSGAVVWMASTPLPGPLTLGQGSAVAGNVVVMADGYLYAFDRRTGSPRWEFIGEPGTYAGNAIPAGNATFAFAGSQTGFAYALEAETGDVVWSTPPPFTFGTMAFDPVVNGDLVFFGYAPKGGEREGGIAALDVATGAVIWAREFTANVAPTESARFYGNVTVHDNTVFAAIDNGAVFALNRTTGTIRWQTPALQSNLEQRPTVLTRGVLVVGSVAGHLTGLDPENGSILWDRYVNQGSLVAPFTAGDRLVYLATIGSAFLAIDPTTGQVQWNAGLSDSREYGFFGTAAIDSANVYIGGSKGLFAFRR